jgi:hypothetical protein
LTFSGRTILLGALTFPIEVLAPPVARIPVTVTIPPVLIVTAPPPFPAAEP